jgi:SnoaL-like domain
MHLRGKPGAEAPTCRAHAATACALECLRIEGDAITFRETLDRHLQSIQERDLSTLIDTLPAEKLILIMADGRLVRDTAEFVELHRAWFAETTWSLDARLVSLDESPTNGVAVLRLDYRDEPPGQQRIIESSYSTLIFTLRDGRWLMTHEQNTPIRTSPDLESSA